MQENIELPKSLFVSFSDYEYSIINSKPLYAFEKTLEEISTEKPILAANLLENELLYGRPITPNIQIVSDLGVISTEMDGPQIAFGAFHKSIEHNILGEIVVSPMDIIISTFHVIKRMQRNEETIISVPKFIINLSQTII
jgi:hypothetical protein